jgi:predicted nucleic acid-binding protein
LNAYFDSGLLFKLYVPEVESPRVARLAQTFGQLPITQFHEFELRNAFRAKLFRGELDARQLAASIALLEADIATGRGFRPVLKWSDTFDRAETFSDKHTARIGCRALDILHVASAHLLNARVFATTDQRQKKLAIAVGLKVAAI